MNLFHDKALLNVLDECNRYFRRQLLEKDYDARFRKFHLEREVIASGEEGVWEVSDTVKTGYGRSQVGVTNDFGCVLFLGDPVYRGDLIYHCRR